MIQTIFSILKMGMKFALILAVIVFFLSYFGQYLIFALYHINLSMYFFLAPYADNSTITIFTIGIVIMLMMFMFKIIKRVI